MFKSISLKLGNARKAQDYTIYPYTGSGSFTLQSNSRIAQVDMDGKGIVSNSHPSGAYFHHLIFERNPIQLDKKELTELKLIVLGGGEKLEGGGLVAEQNLEGIRL